MKKYWEYEKNSHTNFSKKLLDMPKLKITPLFVPLKL
jgi:hypothetical protein